VPLYFVKKTIINYLDQDKICQFCQMNVSFLSDLSIECKNGYISSAVSMFAFILSNEKPCFYKLHNYFAILSNPYSTTFSSQYTIPMWSSISFYS